MVPVRHNVVEAPVIELHARVAWVVDQDVGVAMAPLQVVMPIAVPGVKLLRRALIQSRDRYGQKCVGPFEVGRRCIRQRAFVVDRVKKRPAQREDRVFLALELQFVKPAKEVLEQQHATLIPKPKAAVEAKEAKEEKPHATKKVSAATLPTGIFYDEQGAPWFRVGKGDTLSGIAQAHLGRASRAIQIANRNQDRLPDPNNLRPGQELRLPNDASQVRVIDSQKALR